MAVKSKGKEFYSTCIVKPDQYQRLRNALITLDEVAGTNHLNETKIKDPKEKRKPFRALHLRLMDGDHLFLLEEKI